MLKPFFIRQDNKALQKIDPTDVVGIFTEGNYTRIFLSNETYYMVRSSLEKTLKKLPRDIFFKTHRSYAVSVNYIDCIYKDHLLLGKSIVPIARQYYQPLIERLNIIE